MSLSAADLADYLRVVLARGDRLRFTSPGHSMYPFLRDGDSITVAPLGGSLARRGDIIAFCHPATDRLTIHRVVARRAHLVLARGDNCGGADGAIRDDSILGRVSAVARRGRPVRLGGGPERVLIAFLSERSLLIPAVTLGRRMRRRLTAGRSS